MIKFLTKVKAIKNIIHAYLKIVSAGVVLAHLRLGLCMDILFNILYSPQLKITCVAI
jgi:hypothetical protein